MTEEQIGEGSRLRDASEARAASPAKNPARFTVGVLFVHGIGEQPQGDTLIRFAHPVVEWITRWVGRRDGNGEVHGGARVTDSVLAASRLWPDIPPHATLEVEPGRHAGSEDDPPHKSVWLFAESWWGSEFHRPRFGELAGWLLSTGSWMIMSHAGKTARLTRGWDRFRAILVLVFAVPAALLVQLLVGLLAILAAIPIPQLRGALSGLLLKLTGTLGDSYVLVSSPLQRAAAVSHLGKDIEWLSPQCETVVVVAHSQGAAIAHEALQSSEPANVSRLITVGSGLAKLEELRIVASRQSLFFLLSRLVIPTFVISAFFSPKLLPAFTQSDNFGAFVALVFLAIFLIALITLAFEGPKSYLKSINKLSLHARRPELKWVDYYSSADPVPNGPLCDPSQPFDGMRSQEVVNHMSLVGDHSAYWENGDQFVSLVVREINDAANTGLFLPDELGRLDRAATERWGRVFLLFIMRQIVFICAIVAVFALREALFSIGRATYDTLKVIPILEAVAYLLRAIGLAVERLGSNVLGVGSDKTRYFGFASIGALIPIGLLILWYKLAFRLWKWREKLELRRIFDPLAFPNHPTDRAFVISVVFAVGLFPVMVVVYALIWPDPRELFSRVLSTLYLGATLSLALLFLIAIVVGLVKNVVDAIRFVRTKLSSRKAPEN